MSEPSATKIANARFSLERMCSVPADRLAVIEQLLESIAFVQEIAPESWALTRFEHGFRMNVGSVEAYACLHGKVRLLLACEPGAINVAGIEPIRYASVPLPQAVYVSPASELALVRRRLCAAHLAYLRAAALRRDGQARRCAYTRYHCEALLAAARQMVGKTGSEVRATEDPASKPKPTRSAGANRWPYNGFTWHERDAKYREMQRRIETGSLAAPRGPCRLCWDPGSSETDVVFEYHDEDYRREYTWSEPAAYVLCRSCHVHRLHKRFSNPIGWLGFVAHVRRGGYARDLRDPNINKELKAYCEDLKSGRPPRTMVPLRPYPAEAGKEWFAHLSMDWNDMLRRVD